MHWAAFAYCVYSFNLSYVVRGASVNTHAKSHPDFCLDGFLHPGDLLLLLGDVI
jgi:hypothetical protein